MKSMKNFLVRCSVSILGYVTGKARNPGNARIVKVQNRNLIQA